jgi:hypothetical protein
MKIPTLFILVLLLSTQIIGGRAAYSETLTEALAFYDFDRPFHSSTYRGPGEEKTFLKVLLENAKAPEVKRLVLQNLKQAGIRDGRIMRSTSA